MGTLGNILTPLKTLKLCNYTYNMPRELSSVGR